MFSDSLGMDGHAGDGTGAPGRSRADYFGPRASAVDSAAPSPTGAGAAQRLEEMLLEHRAADVARAGAVGRDSARIKQERRAKADAQEAKYKAAVANDRKVAAAAKAVAKATSKADVRQEEETQAVKQAAGTSSPALSVSSAVVATSTSVKKEVGEPASTQDAAVFGSVVEAQPRAASPATGLAATVTPANAETSAEATPTGQLSTAKDDKTKHEKSVVYRFAILRGRHFQMRAAAKDKRRVQSAPAAVAVKGSMASDPMRGGAGVGARIAAKVSTDTCRADELYAAQEAAMRCMRQAGPTMVKKGKGKGRATEGAPILAAHSIGGPEARTESAASQLCGRKRLSDELNIPASKAAKRHIGAAVSRVGAAVRGFRDMEGAVKAGTATTRSSAASPASLRSGPATATTQTDQQLAVHLLVSSADKRAASKMLRDILKADKAVELAVGQMCAAANAASVAAEAASNASPVLKACMGWPLAATVSPHPDILAQVAASAGVHHRGRGGKAGAPVQLGASARHFHALSCNCGRAPTVQKACEADIGEAANAADDELSKEACLGGREETGSSVANDIADDEVAKEAEDATTEEEAA